MKNKNYKFVFNHLQGSNKISIKSNLVMSLDKYYSNNERALKAGFGTFNVTPVTCILSEEDRDQ